MRLSRRHQLAARRFLKVLLAGILPVLIASLQAQQPDWRATGIAVAVAALLAVHKYASYEAARDPERTGRVPIARLARRAAGAANTTSTNGTGTVTMPTRPRRPHEPTHT